MQDCFRVVQNNTRGLLEVPKVVKKLKTHNRLTEIANKATDFATDVIVCVCVCDGTLVLDGADVSLHDEHDKSRTTAIINSIFLVQILKK